MKIRFMKVQCSKCGQAYTVNLGLKDESLFCYSCGQPMSMPAVDMELNGSVNSLLDKLSVDYRVELGETGIAPTNPLLTSTRTTA